MSASRFALCVAVAVACVSIVFLPAPARAQGPGGLYGSTVVVATTSVLDTDPMNLSAANEPLHSLIYDSLGRASSTNLVPQPWLAESWDVNLTADTVTFHIRSNAKWWDGTALTAAAVKATYERYRTASIVSGFTVDPPADATTVVFHFTSGGGDFLGKWATLPIAFADATGPATSSGIFRIGTVVPGASLQILANPNHWHGRPYPDAILYQFHTGPSALDTAACDLIAKKVDFLAAPLTPGDLTATRPCGQLQQVGNASLAHIYAAEDPGFTFLQLGVNTQHAPLNDTAFRVAVTSALDRVLITTIEPRVQVADSVLTPADSFWFNASVPQYRVEKAVIGGNVVPILDNVNEMLDAAGYLDRNGDGWRETPAGTPFTLSLLHLNATVDPRIAKVLGILTNLHNVGINVLDVEASPTDIADAARTGSYDMYVGMTTTTPDPSFLFNMFHSSKIGAAGNYNRVSDPALDASLVSVRDDLDRSARQKAARDVQGILGTDALAMPLVHYNLYYVYNRLRFEGWVDEPGGIDNFWSFASLHVIQHGPLSVAITPIANSLFSGRTTTVLVDVADSGGNGVEGADVVLTGSANGTVVGKTNAIGRFTANFTAPAVTSAQDVALEADVTTPGYDGATASTAITVSPPTQSLTVTMTRGLTVLEPGRTCLILVTVENRTAFVGGATVTLGLSPAGVGGSLTASTGTTLASNGSFWVGLTSTAGTQTTYLVTATVTAPGYTPATASVSVLANRRGTAPPSTPGLDTATMVVVVAAAAFVFARWQTRRRKE